MKTPIRYGVARGFSPTKRHGLHPTPTRGQVKHPVEQGCVAIAAFHRHLHGAEHTLVILVTGAFQTSQRHHPDQNRFHHRLGQWDSFCAICLFFFAFPTSSAGTSSANRTQYLFGVKAYSLQLIVMGFVVLGSTLKLDLLLGTADFFNGIILPTCSPDR